MFNTARSMSSYLGTPAGKSTDSRRCRQKGPISRGTQRSMSTAASAFAGFGGFTGHQRR